MRLKIYTRPAVNVYVVISYRKCFFFFFFLNLCLILTRIFILNLFYWFSRNVPVKLAYASYESVNETEQDSKQPIMIMHGLFGSKNNWNSLSKAIHQRTKRKVINNRLK